MGPKTNNSTVQMWADQSGRDYFLPYLTQGYSPVFTSGAEAQCGVRALFLSWRSACLQAGRRDLPNYDTFRKLLSEKRYGELCDEHIRVAFPKGRPKDKVSRDSYDDFVKETRKRNWLHPEGLARLLQVANEEYGTEYEFAYILEGYHGHYDEDGVWDAAWDYPTEVNTSLISEDKLNRPVIFVWNNNADSKALAHKKGKVAAHWEGFELPRGDGDTPEEARRRGKVQKWRMGNDMLKDLDKGVWRVNETYEGTGTSTLSVRAGHFLREADPPQDLKVPMGWEYM